MTTDTTRNSMQRSKTLRNLKYLNLYNVCPIGQTKEFGKNISFTILMDWTFDSLLLPSVVFIFLYINIRGLLDRHRSCAVDAAIFPPVDVFATLHKVSVCMIDAYIGLYFFYLGM
jgi:hypothetical protein